MPRALKKELSDIKIQNALDTKDEEEFVGDEDSPEFGLTEDEKDEVHSLIAMAEKNGSISDSDKTKAANGIKTTTDEKRKRLREIIEVSNRGFTYAELVEYGMRRWECSKRTVERYISEAKKIEAIPEKDLKDLRNDAVMRCRYIYKIAVKAQNEGIALQAQKEINKLLGLYSDQIIATQGGKENPLDKLIREMHKNQLKPEDIAEGAIRVEEEIGADSEV